MARRQTLVLTADQAGVRQAADLLRAGRLVAFPTETVYGLGAHALDVAAVRGIFEAKMRPADDPLIVHVATTSQLESIAQLSPEARQLGARFWPGPLTLVLPKFAVVPGEVTAGLDTVAVRMPSHPVAQALLAATGLPIAAPSANLFGRPSPTRATHVLHDLDGRIDALIDGGPTSVGVESTIADLSTNPPRLLRPGGVPAEAIEAVLGVKLGSPSPTRGAQPAPGMLPVHYSPRTPLHLARDREHLVRAVDLAVKMGVKVGVLALEEDAAILPREAQVEVVGTWSNPERSAARLFEALRSLDEAGLDALYVRELADPDVGLGRALADRLRRASRRVLDARD